MVGVAAALHHHRGRAGARVPARAARTAQDHTGHQHRRELHHCARHQVWSVHSHYNLTPILAEQIFSLALCC